MSNHNDKTPSLELDALVAEKVLRCTVIWREGTERIPACDCQPDALHGHTVTRNLWRFSTDPRRAWDLIDKLEGSFETVQKQSADGTEQYEAIFHDASGNRVAATGDTAALAICRAALTLVDGGASAAPAPAPAPAAVAAAAPAPAAPAPAAPAPAAPAPVAPAQAAPAPAPAAPAPAPAAPAPAAPAPAAPAPAAPAPEQPAPAPAAPAQAAPPAAPPAAPTEQAAPANPADPGNQTPPAAGTPVWPS